ncbi:hypothetical protein BH18THE1_BH18THE1_20960 [soil metagenome]
MKKLSDIYLVVNDTNNIAARYFETSLRVHPNMRILSDKLGILNSGRNITYDRRNRGILKFVKLLSKCKP